MKETNSCENKKTSNLNIELYLYVLYINTTYSLNDILKEIT